MGDYEFRVGDPVRWFHKPVGYVNGAKMDEIEGTVTNIVRKVTKQHYLYNVATGHVPPPTETVELLYEVTRDGDKEPWPMPLKTAEEIAILHSSAASNRGIRGRRKARKSIRASRRKSKASKRASKKLRNNE
jgi:hypothetical protein